MPNLQSQNVTNAPPLNSDQEALLHKLVYDLKFFFGRDKVFQYLQTNYPEAGISRRQVSAWMETQSVYQQTKQVTKREDTTSLNIAKEGFLNIDLIGEMYEERGYHYALTCLDLGTRRCFIKPIKQKTAINVRDAFDAMVTENNLKTSVVKSDNGTEFKAEFLEYLDEKGIKHFNSAPATPWTNVLERYHRTMKGALKKYELATGKKNWIEPLTTIVENMNTTWSKTLKTTPNEAKDLPDEVRLDRLKRYGVKRKRNNGKTAFQIGDIVRKRIYRGGKLKKQKETFSEDTYIVSGINRGSDNKMVTYKLTSDGDKHIAGTYNISDLILVNSNEAPNRELLDPEDIQVGERSKQDQREVNELNKNTEKVSEVRDSTHPDPDAEGFYVVEKIIQRRKFGKIWKYKVKWKGYDSSFNTWQTARDLSNAKELLNEFNESRKK